MIPVELCNTKSIQFGIFNMELTDMTKKGFASEDVEGTMDTFHSNKIDSSQKWMVILTVFLAYTLTGTLDSSFAVFYVEYTEYFGTSKGLTGWISSIYIGFSCITGRYA